MTTYYLMIKTHATTGLKYLCQTTRNPHTYLGSGKDWKPHLVKHGKEHTTEIVQECSSKEELSYWGRHYSRLWNIVDAMDDYGNKIWANRIPETGGGSFTHINDNPIERNRVSNIVSVRLSGIPKTEIWKENHANVMTGRTYSADINDKKALPGEKNGMWGKTHTAENKKEQAKRAVKQFKGKTYEEIYGVEKAAELKKIRSEHFKRLRASEK